jgi:hypothetical protein
MPIAMIKVEPDAVSGGFDTAEGRSQRPAEYDARQRGEDERIQYG